MDPQNHPVGKRETISTEIQREEDREMEGDVEIFGEGEKGTQRWRDSGTERE